MGLIWLGLRFLVGWCNIVCGGFGFAWWVWWWDCFSGFVGVLLVEFLCLPVFERCVVGCRFAARVLGLILAVYVCYVRVVCSVVLDLVGFWCFGCYAVNAGFGVL